MNTKKEEWIKTLHHVLEESKQIPMWGKAPSIDLKKISSSLSQSMKIPALSAQADAPTWIDADTMKRQIQNKSSSFFQLSHLPGQLIWIMSEQEQKLLSYHLLSSQGIKGALSTSFQQGFYKYLLMQAMHHFDESRCLGDLHPSMTNGSVEDDNFCLFPVRIHVKDMSFSAQMAVSSSLQKSLQRHYNETPISLADGQFPSDLELSIALQVGRVTLSVKQLRSVKTGDFIILDHCSYDPILQKGSVTLLLEQTPILHGKLKKSSIKIQDFAYYYEEEKSMTDQDKSFDDSFSPDDLSEKENPEEFSGAESFLGEEEEETKEHMWSEGAPQKGSLEKMIPTNEIPLTLTIEVDRMRMSLGKLLELSPGNILELSARPEQGVSVTVGGKKIAHGEIVKIGDALGLKILKIAK